MKKVNKQRNKTRASLQFSNTQLAAIDKGAQLRNSLLKAARKAAEVDAKSLYPHTYLYSPAGLGKTYNVLKSVKTSSKPFRLITGNNTLWSFGVDLLNIHAIKPKGSKFIIIVDDCDALLDVKNLDIMKNVLSANKVFSYQAQINTSRLDPDTQLNMLKYQTPGRLGFEVPCEDFIFIFCSNFRLPYDDQTSKIQAKGTSSAAKKMNGFSALRSRLNTKDFDMDWQTQWGWIVTVILDDNGLNGFGLKKEEQIVLLDWMYNNWSNMKETNIRTAVKMAQIMVDDKNYRSAWETDFLK